MKITSKITALVLSMVLLFTMVTPAFAAPKANQITTRAEYASFLTNESGVPALTTAQFLKIIDVASDFFRLMTNGKFPSTERIDVSFDKLFLDTSNYVLANSGLDVVSLFKHFPTLNVVPTMINEKLELDVTATRKFFYDLREECYKNNMPEMGDMFYFLGVYMSIIEKAYFYMVPTKEENVYAMYLDLTFKDGYTEKLNAGILLNTETGDFYGAAGNGLLDTGFNMNMDTMVIYTILNCWQRDFGYAVTYDVAASLLPMWELVTRRFEFEYKGLEWRIQVWKGIYMLIAPGGEVGVYNRVPGEELGTFYNCATDEYLMPMSMKLSHKDTVLIDWAPENHWWINAYRLNGKYYTPESLTLEFSIEMPDMEMVKAFTKSIENEEHKDTTYTVKGTTVSVVWAGK